MKFSQSFALLLGTLVFATGPASARQPEVAVKPNPALQAEQTLAGKLHRAQEPKGNVITSPYGLFEVLTALHMGAAGETRQELESLWGGQLPSGSLTAQLKQSRKAGLPLMLNHGGQLQDNNRYGLMLTESPAANSALQQAGLSKGDLLFTVDGQPLRTVDDFADLLEFAGEVVTVTGYDLSKGETFSKKIALSRGVDANTPLASRQMLFATAFWIDQQEKLADGFETYIQDALGGQVFSADFSQPAEIAKQAEQFFHRATANRLRRLYTPRNLPQDAKMLLSNIVFLDAKWQYPFAANQTKPGEFLSGEQKLNVHFMNQTEYFRYAETKDYQALELPYRDSTVSMFLVLPRDSSTFTGMEQWLWTDAGLIPRIRGAMKETEVKVALPRFKFSSHGSLKETLQELGVKQAFTTKADFRGITPDGTLRLSDVYQQTMIEVNEEGTIAGSETQAVGIPRSISKPKEFIANRPFLFMIADRDGTVFFTGRVTEPTIAPAE